MNRTHALHTLARLVLVLPMLTACDQLQERMGIPVAAKVEAEGKAIGSACRHAGRGLEDCYRLNPEADKAAVHTGWREMNEYMIKNNMQSLAPQFPAEPPAKPGAKKPAKEGDGHGEEDAADKDAEHGEKAAHGEKDETAKDGKGKEDPAKDAKSKDDAHAADKDAAQAKHAKKASDEKKAAH